MEASAALILDLRSVFKLSRYSSWYIALPLLYLLIFLVSCMRLGIADPPFLFGPSSSLESSFLPPCPPTSAQTIEQCSRTSSACRTWKCSKYPLPLHTIPDNIADIHVMRIGRSFYRGRYRTLCREASNAWKEMRNSSANRGEETGRAGKDAVRANRYMAQIRRVSFRG